ncbi:MAG TPA: PQQ-dependent sugar dehydrogenase [Thermoanaerobaculia bacterium]|nr:PQQ-dependent sugar dehydrogenase [Thermoanaerobaculia bacterium]
MNIRCVLIALFFTPMALAATRPETPVIAEPAADGQIVSGADLHMVTGAFADADGDEHRCTDWEIANALGERIWRAECATGTERLHIHLGDGAFAGHHLGRTEILPGAGYVLRVRHRDDSGDAESEWSDWSRRTFTVAEPLQMQPLRVRDIASSPSPRWVDDEGNDVAVPDGAHLVIEAADGASLVELRGEAQQAVIEDAAPLDVRSTVRVAIDAGPDGWQVRESDLAFQNFRGQDIVVYLPALSLGPFESAVFWIGENGGTHFGAASDRFPDFSRPARGAPIPWEAPRGFVVERVAGDFRLPVNIAFARASGEEPDSPFFYVAELYGDIKAVTRSGEVRDYATNLLDFDPAGPFPGSGETGLVGMAAEATGDLVVTMVYHPDLNVPARFSKVARLRSGDGGRKAISRETLLDIDKELDSPSHQISCVTVGPDQKLYVQLADASRPETAQDLTSFRGKILRMNGDGSAPEDNPWCDPSDGTTATDYIYASGFRNPFGGAWRAFDQSLYEVENGPFTDRMAKVVAGENYGWDGTDESMTRHALCTWHTAAPVNIAFVQSSTFGGSGFPAALQDVAFVSESGPTWATGPQEFGKRISAVRFKDDGTVHSPETFVAYTGTGKATPVALAAGPDGLYFSDLYKDYGYATPIDRGANVFRVRWSGYAEFVMQPLSGDALALDFVNRSELGAATSWSWDFGDGTTSAGRDARHRFPEPGTYLVRLTATDGGSSFARSKRVQVGEGSGTGLTGEYYASPDLTGLQFSRNDPEIDLDWARDRMTSRFRDGGFSVRWTGAIIPRYSEIYRFTVRTSGRVHLVVDGEVLIDDATPVSGGVRSGEVELVGGSPHEILLEYFDADGAGDEIELLWQSESQKAEVVPPTALVPSMPSRREPRGGTAPVTVDEGAPPG